MKIAKTTGLKILQLEIGVKGGHRPGLKQAHPNHLLGLRSERMKILTNHKSLTDLTMTCYSLRD